MSERRGDRRRRSEAEVETSPIRWDRVDSIVRRKRLLILIGVVLAAAALTLAAVLVAFAGKSAIDPSFTPPILSNTSASLDIQEPRMGWELVRGGSTGGRGYVARAVLDVEGLKGDALVPQWSIRPAGRPIVESSGTISAAESAPVTPDSNSDHLTLRQWVPTPPRAGRYVSELRLTTFDGRVLVASRSEPFFVVGTNCCRRYETPAYVAPIPRGWDLAENFELNPGDRHVTLAIGPYDNSLVIDTSVIDPENVGKTAVPFQEELERGLEESEQGYSRISKRVFRAPDGEPVVEWSYRLEGDVLTDILFFRGPSGFAILGRSGESHFHETRDLTRFVAHSLEAKPEVLASAGG